MRRLDAAARVVTVRREPARPSGIVPEVVVPFLRSAITAGLLAAVAHFVLETGERLAMAIALLSGLLVWGALSWLGQRMLWKTEEVFGADIDGDGVKGEPVVSEHLYEIHQSDDEGRAHINRIKLKTDPAKLAMFAESALAERSLGVASWTGAGRPFSRGEFEAMREELILHGYAERVGRGSNATWQLTARGRSLFRRMARKDE